MPHPRPPRVPEKVEQQHIVTLLRSLGARVYVLGHASPKDGRTHRGTGQTPGIADLEAFISKRGELTRTLLKIEVKAAGGRLSPEQRDYQHECQAANVAHIVGGYDAVVAWLLEHGFLATWQVPHYRVPAPKWEARP